MPRPHTASSIGHLWYVEAAGGVWGPYTEARMAEFVAEGRINPATGVSPWIAGPFERAGETLEFAGLLKVGATRAPVAAPARALAPSPLPSSPPLAAQGAAQGTDHVPSPVAGGRALVVWAALASLSAAAFEAALAAYGPSTRLREGLWLIRASVTPAVLRNGLSRRLKAGDALLVIEAPLEQAAWFNLDQGAERELRRLWAGG